MEPFESSDRVIDLARQVIGLPRRRTRAFGFGVVNDVQWDMLVSLYIAEHDREAMALASLTLGSGAAVEDARRWLAELVERKLIWLVAGDDGTIERAELTPLARRRVRHSLIGDSSDE